MRQQSSKRSAREKAQAPISAGHVSDSELEALTVKELRQLVGRIDDTVRGKIRAQRLAKEAGKKVSDAPTAQEKAQRLAESPDKTALERERDAWLASRK